MTLPLISIVLPTFNGERYLSQALDSCLEQSYRNVEVIAVDDASSDTTREILERYRCADRRIRVVRHASNRKLPAALNTGFSLASGDMLTWISDDNQYRPNALAVMAQTLCDRPEIDIVYADYTLYDEIGEGTQQVSVDDSDQLAVFNCVGPCFLYRRSVHQAVGGYDEKMFLAEDYDFWLRASLQFSLQPLHHDLYVYRHHGESLTSLKAARIQRATACARSRFYAAAVGLNGETKARGWLHQVGTAKKCRQSRFAALCLCRAILAAPSYVLRSERRILREIWDLIRQRG